LQSRKRHVQVVRGQTSARGPAAEERSRSQDLLKPELDILRKALSHGGGSPSRRRAKEGDAKLVRNDFDGNARGFGQSRRTNGAVGLKKFVGGTGVKSGKTAVPASGFTD
jgi:hypothetical protein